MGKTNLSCPTSSPTRKRFFQGQVSSLGHFPTISLSLSFIICKMEPLPSPSYFHRRNLTSLWGWWSRVRPDSRHLCARMASSCLPVVCSRAHTVPSLGQPVREQMVGRDPCYGLWLHLCSNIAISRDSCLCFTTDSEKDRRCSHSITMSQTEINQGTEFFMNGCLLHKVERNEEQMR